jgi:ABC-type uncharacterized transport system substrate-binding protein
MAGESKYKIGYIEGGSFWMFDEVMTYIKENLEKEGWKDKVSFPNDAHFSPGWANKEELEQRAEELMKRRDLAMIIAGGSGATDAILAANNNRTPIISITVADPVKSKFVLSETDSGTDNYTTRINPSGYKPMFSVFHDVVKFKKLGMIYTDLPNGRIIGNVEDAYEIAEQRGFEIAEYVYKVDRTKEDPPDDICLEGLQTLYSQGIDAFFIPALSCFDWTKSDVEKLLNFLTEKKIPSFARDGVNYVKSGALLGFSSQQFELQGKFHTNQIIKILEGASPRSLPMLDTTIPAISVNLAVAEKIGFSPSVAILSASDEIFEEITLPRNRFSK